MSLGKFVDFETKILEPRKIMAQGALSNQLLRAEESWAVDHMRDQTIHRLTAYVYEDRTQRLAVTRRIEEPPTHGSWRHHRIASLPLGSFRRRFLCYWWAKHEISLDYVGRRRWHELDLQRIAMYPLPPALPERAAGPMVVNWYDESRSGIYGETAHDDAHDDDESPF